MGDVGSHGGADRPVVAIHQPNYLPWIGYFHKMSLVDIFVLLDDVQFPQGSANCFCSRVKVKGTNGGQWLTVPVHHALGKKINEITIAGEQWAKKHVRTIEQLYGKAPYFDECWPCLRAILMSGESSLATLNFRLIKAVAGLLGITASLRLSSEFAVGELTGEKRLLAILRKLDASAYVTGKGKGAERYIADEDFAASGIALQVQGFEHPVYPQFYGEFEPKMSVVDMLFHDRLRFQKLSQQTPTI